MRGLFPAFNAEEAFVVERLDQAEKASLARILCTVIEHLEDSGQPGNHGQ